MITCIIVDDEPIAREILEKFVMETPGLTLLATCRNAMEAIGKLEQQEVDLIFLDIEMPLVNGLHFLKTLNDPPHIILTTAYPQYAVEAFALNAVDYLLKPFSIERFQAAVQKVKPRSVSEKNETGAAHVMIREKGALVKLLHDEIIYLQASGDYVKIITRQKTHLVSMTMKLLEEALPSTKFIRIHKSYIVALKEIRAVKTAEVVIAGKQVLPLSPNYKGLLMELYAR